MRIQIAAPTDKESLLFFYGGFPRVEPTKGGLPTLGKEAVGPKNAKIPVDFAANGSFRVEEIGSRMAAGTTTHSRSNGDFLVLAEYPPNGRGCLARFCLCNGVLEPSQPFRPLCLCPKNSVSRQRRLRFEETRFEFTARVPC